MSEDARRFGVFCSWLAHFDGIIAKIRHREILEQKTAVRVRISPHSPDARWRELGKLDHKLAVFVEELFRFVTFHPLFKLSQVLRPFSEVRNRNLVRPPRAFYWFAIDDLGSCPAFGRAQDDHRPDGERADLA